MHRFRHILGALFLSVLITIQVDELGEPLINGHKGLAFVVIVLIVYAAVITIRGINTKG